MREYGEEGISPYWRFLAAGEDRYQAWDHEWLLANQLEFERAMQGS